MGLLLAILMSVPLGRVSGAHMNPAISLAMWRVSHLRGQLLGSRWINIHKDQIIIIVSLLVGVWLMGKSIYSLVA